MTAIAIWLVRSVSCVHCRLEGVLKSGCKLVSFPVFWRPSFLTRYQHLCELPCRYVLGRRCPQTPVRATELLPATELGVGAVHARPATTFSWQIRPSVQRPAGHRPTTSVQRPASSIQPSAHHWAGHTSCTSQNRTSQNRYEAWRLVCLHL